MTDLQTILREQDSFAAIEQIQRHGTPLEIAARYQALLSDFYWKAHDLSACVTLGRAGILYCLGQSLIAGTPADAVEQLRSIAKGLAFDLGSFTWPGWEEPAIHPSPADLAFGSDCAHLNLRLALELHKPPDRLSMAHWLVGAHALAAGDFKNAELHFQKAQEVIPPNDPAAKAMAPCNLGFLALAQLGQDPANVAALTHFTDITTALSTRTDPDAHTYLTQLLAARRLFTPAH